MDLNMFREDKGGNPEMIRESQRRRFAPVEDVDKVVDADQVWRKGSCPICLSLLHVIKFHEQSSTICRLAAMLRSKNRVCFYRRFPHAHSDLHLVSLARFELDQNSKAISAIQREITAKKKAKENADKEIEDAAKVKALTPALEEAETTARTALEAILNKIGNLVHQSVPVSKDEVRHFMI
jgi:seryl-tRNA synthetase